MSSQWAEGLISVYTQNPRFMQGTANEPLTLDIPLLGALAEETSRNIEASADEIEDVDSAENPFEERRGPTAEQLMLKKRRTIRFSE
jgi:hypothetical protein